MPKKGGEMRRSIGYGTLIATVTILAWAFAGVSGVQGAPRAQDGQQAVFLPLVFNRSGSGNLQILSGSSTYFDNYYRRHVVGEVENLGDEPVDSVLIDAKFYDDTGQLAAENQNGIYLHRLAPHDHTCFDIFVIETPGFTSYTLDVSRSLIANHFYPQLSMSNNNAWIDDSNSSFQVNGSVQNVDTQRVQDVLGVVTLYDADNKIVDCDYAYTNPSSLDAGESAPLAINLFSRSAVDSYSTVKFIRTQLDANP
jgi:hypothetical protein